MEWGQRSYQAGNACVPIAKVGEAAEHKGECPEMLRVQEESGVEAQATVRRLTRRHVADAELQPQQRPTGLLTYAEGWENGVLCGKTNVTFVAGTQCTELGSICALSLPGPTHQERSALHWRR